MENIAIIIQKLNGGGAERAVANLSKDLSKRYNVNLIVFDGKNISYPYCGNLIDLNLPPKNGFFGKGVTLFRRILRVREIKKKLNIECSISFMPGANIVNLLSKRKDSIVTSQRNMMSIVTKSKLERLCIKFVAKYSQKTVALSKGVEYDLINKFGVSSNKIVTIYNSCDRAWIMKSSSQIESIISKMDTNNKYIITVGRLHYQKGQWHLIRAFKYVQQIIPEARLIILGKGELENSLKKLAIKLEIEDKIDFLGYVKNHHKLLEKCDVFVFPSLVEGLGNVLLEAMACGLPIISTDCFSGPREIIAPDTNLTQKTENIERANYGILVPSFDINDIDYDNININKEEKIMGEAIIEILNNKAEKKKYSLKSKERINDFSEKNIANQWIKLIDSLSDSK